MRDSFDNSRPRDLPEVLEDGPKSSRLVAQSRSGAIFKALLLLAAILISGLLGYRLGISRQSPGVSPYESVSPSESTPFHENLKDPLVPTTNRCSAQSGRQLQLGIELENMGSTVLVLRRISPVLYGLGGLRAIDETRGPCGVPSTAGLTNPLNVGEATWIRMTFDVLVTCPAYVPVAFQIEYTADGTDRVETVKAFDDLGGVPYSSC